MKLGSNSLTRIMMLALTAPVVPLLEVQAIVGKQSCSRQHLHGDEHGIVTVGLRGCGLANRCNDIGEPEHLDRVRPQQTPAGDKSL